jgi:colanic acid/amylovoran biosynthesis glycosyltransferase
VVGVGARGAPRERILLNPCGVDLAGFPPGDAAGAPPHFLAAGRFVGKKGPVYTLLAFRRLLERAPEARLTMLGEGEMRSACEQLAAALGLAARVDFPGAYAHGELAARLRRSRAFVQHSLRQPDGDSEGTPVALLEAAASGVPAVSTRHAGIPQAVVDGEGGLLCDEGDVEAMADAMVQLALDPGLAGAMGRRAREHVAARYAIDLRLGRLGELLARVARGDSPVVNDSAAADETVGEQPAPLAAGRQ